MLSFTLLRQVVLSQDGVPLSKFRSQKEAALLIYLAHTNQPHPREFLAELLWESSSTKQSLANLRTALSRLRKQVGQALLVTRKTVALAPEHVEFVDTAVLLQTITTSGQIDSPATATTLQQTLDTYQGDFLSDFHLSATPQFNEWAAQTRTQIRRQVIATCDKLGQYALTTNDTEFGIQIARRWLQIDALDESAHTLLIQMLIQAGSVREAVDHYEHCTQLLHTELGIDPPAKMVTLISAVRPKRSPPSRPVSSIRHNLPPAYDQFFGRETLLQEIHIRLNQPWCRLVTLVGQGGVGKTRLATTIAHSRLSQYPDGVWLIELANIDSDDDDLAEAIAVEIATILDLRLTGAAKPIDQLLDHLQHKQMLLVLDNFEHLLDDGVQIVLDIVQRCTTVQLLATSREALKLRAEWTIALTGLSYPTSDSDDTPSEAVELFAARQAQQQYGRISTDDLTAIRTICRMVAGLPLAIELAAALTRHTPVQTVADSLHDGFNTLAASLRDVPQRHQSLHIVFEMSWQTLTPDLQTKLAQLSLFRGGFTLQAAQHITQTTQQHLAALIEKSLLTHNTTTNRYTLHPVIRAYAAEKRVPSDPTPQQHAAYFLTLLAEHSEPIQKNRPQDSISILEPDIDNIRLAWQTGLAKQQADELYAALTTLSTYYQLRGPAYEGESVMKTTGNTTMTWESDGTTLAIQAGLEQARFQNRLGQYRPAIQTIKTTLKRAAQQNDRWANGMGFVWWGESLWRLGKYELAQKKLTDALKIAQTLDAPLIIGWCHHQLGIINDIQSRYSTAHDHLEKACIVWQDLNNTQAMSVSLNSIGLVSYHQGNLPAAKQELEKALTFCDQINNDHLKSSLLNNLSMIATEQGDYTGAEYYLQLGLELANMNGNLANQGEIYISLGRNCRLQDDTESAIKNLARGTQIAKLTGDRSMRATATLILAEIQKDQGNLEQAQPLYIQSLEIAQQDNKQGLECEVLIGMAELLCDVDEFKAKQYSKEAVTLAETIQIPKLLTRAKSIDDYLRG